MARAPLGTVRVRGEGARLVEKKGALMIYRKWVEARGVDHGELVVVENERGETIGCGFYDEVGPVALRLVETLDCSFASPEEVLYTLLERSYDARRRAGLVGAEKGYRLVHSDGDYLPGLIVDVYSELAVTQLSSAVWDKYRDLVTRLVVEVTGARHVYEKSVQRTRLDIGLKPFEKLLYGDKTTTIIREGDSVFFVDARHGQKTGFFLDQRMNRLDFGRLARGRVLDLFSYTGGFGIHALVAGAERAVFVEEDENAIRILRKNLEINRVADRAQIVNENVWGFLGRKHGELYDAVAVDPPAFIPHPGAYVQGSRAYRKLYSRALRLASSSGLVFLSSCSAHLPRQDFASIVAEAFQLAGKHYLPLGDIRGMPPDHPVRPAAPHLSYLKALFAIAY